jgi:anti-sigma factor RsiW
MNHFTPDRLIDFIHGELSPVEDALAHAHLATCGACRVEYDFEASLGGALRSAAIAEEREMPSLVSAAVWQRIREAKPGPFARLAALLQPAVAVPLAALLIVGGWFSLPYSHAAPRPTIEAAYYFQIHAAQSSQTSLSERTSQPFETSALHNPVNVAPSAGGVTTGYASAGTLDAVQ